MKKMFLNYLESIGITTKSLVKRIEKICEFCLEIYSEDIVDIFIDDYINEDGTREYEDLSLFTDRYVISAKKFLTQDEFLMTLVNKKLTHLLIKKQDYDFKKATEKSRLNVRIGTGAYLHGDFKASKENCDFLREITIKYFIPNIKD